MRLLICGSTSFFKDMQKVQWDLKPFGHEVQIPESAGDGANTIRTHFNKLLWAHAILVLNLEKNEVPDYIGPRTFAEMVIAFCLGKDIFLYGNIPELPWQKEIQALSPILLRGDLSLIKPQ